MDDLVQWLTACLDEDERIARAVEDRSAPWDGEWVADGDNAARTRNGHVLFYGHGDRSLKPGLVAHVAAHDPARVLREIDAKRKIVERYTWLREHGDMGGLTWVLKALALPYADRDGYQESWRP